MGEKLKNPPLLEALCEFRFQPDDPWDWTVPGRFYEKVKDQFPLREEVRGVSIHVDARSGMSTPPTVSPQRIRFKNSANSAMLQCGPRFLAVNQLQPYSRWEAFRALILEAFEKYVSVVEEITLARIGLRYINRIALSAGEAPSEKITVFPAFPKPLQKPAPAFFQRYELQYEEPPRGTLLHQTGVAREGDKTFVMLDLDHVSEDVEELAKHETLSSWLDAVHDRIYDAFVASIPQDLYRRFKGGE